MKFTIPVKLVSTANKREHWGKRARRAKVHRGSAYLLTPDGINVPCTIRMTRIAPRPLDSDNLAISCKSVRDGIADAIGVDDGSELIKWEYDQRKGKPKEYACEVQVIPG